MMQVRLGALDGNTYESDTWSDEDMIAEMDIVGWVFGDGFLETQIERGNLASLYDHVEQFFKDIISGKHANGNITLAIDGQNRTFAASQVVWIELVR